MPPLMQAHGRWMSALLMAGAIAASAGRGAGAAVAFDRPDLEAAQSLQVTVAGVAEGGALPPNYAFDGRNLSPPVSWSEGPPRTRSFVVLMQDADAPDPDGAVNWLVYAIPSKVQLLPRGMRNVASPSNPLGASQGRNGHGSLGYSGPRLPVGEPAHHYHLQVFALDRPLRLRAGAEPEAVLKAMAGHVVARGELVATYAAAAPGAPHGHQKDPSAPAPAPAAPSAEAAPAGPGRWP